MPSGRLAGAELNSAAGQFVVSQRHSAGAGRERASAQRESSWME